MGNNNTSINMTLDRTQPAIYYAGDVISGQVEFTVSERAGNVDHIYLTITGDIGYTTMRKTLIQNGQVDRKTNHHDICIFRKNVVLGQRMLTEEKLDTDKINDWTTMEPGLYTYPFSVRLPDVLPPTLHPKDYPFVRYELELLVEKNWFSANTRLRYPLRIYPRVNLLQISNSQCLVKFNKKCNDITLKGIMQRAGLVPGEQTMLSIEIYNPVHLVIKGIDVCLIQHYEVEQVRRRLEISRVSVPHLFNLDVEHIETTCPIKIPMGIPPSYYFKSKGSHSTVQVNINYDIKLDVKAKGFFSDFELQIPITIGTESTEHLSYVNATTSETDLYAIDLPEVQVAEDNIPSTSKN